MFDSLLFPQANRYGYALNKRVSIALGILWSIGSIAAIAPPPASAQVCGTPGKDGSATSPNGVVNTYYPGTGTAAGGSSTVSIGTMRLGGVTEIGAGDLVLIIQMQNGSTTNFSNTTSYGGGLNSNVGSYEYAKVTNVSGGTLTLAKALTNTYTQVAPTGSTAKQSFQVIRVPQYISASLSGGMTALPWDGSSGGVVAIDVYNTLDFASKSISVTGQGFRGGGSRDVGYYYPNQFTAAKGAVPFIYAGTYGGTTTGEFSNTYPNSKLASFKGEGTAGTPRWTHNGTTLVDSGTEGYPTGDVGRGAPGNAGGGGISGGDYLNSKFPGHDAGGGGGGNIGTGGIGGETWQPPGGRWINGGFGGGGIAASFTKILMGGGGGAGITTNATQMANRPAADGVVNGGPGGGIVVIRAGAITGSGSIFAQGLVGTQGNSTDAGGGGGAGGSVFVSARSGSFNSLTVNVSGGNGSDSTYKEHGPGGGGGGGLVAYGGGATGAPVDIRTGGAAGFDISIGGSTVTNYGSTSGLSGAIAAGLPHSGCTKSNVLLVKRITAINGTTYSDLVKTSATSNDNDPNWPTDYIKGKIDAGNVKPNDEIEYTIYYLNTGNVAASRLKICDRLNKNLIFQTQFDAANIATVGKGIELTSGSGVVEYLTNISDTDKGSFSMTSPVQTDCNLGANQTNAANLSDNVVVVNVATPSNLLPGTIDRGNPNNAYGYVRFKVKLKQ
jgi:uncharacterized repeat protein (TIGR01451 family)